MTDALIDDVKGVVVTTLGIQDRADSLTASSALFGAVPELDSLGVLEVVTTLESHFGITIDDEEFSGEIFETLGSLTQFVEGKLPPA
ncbi:acyl carrier protein [Cellulomonas sp. ICMP 17802]|uniref:acyl carrier protein n=1 Tax=Cellulomonas sp. ICMP 17802 TaxID=3239199 RepID=UPI00351BA4DE